MAVFKLIEGLTYAGLAGENLVGKLNYLVNVNSDGEIVLGSDNGVVIGSLFEEGPAGAAVSVQLGGIAKVVCAGSITAGTRVACGTGGKVKTTSGTNPCGIALRDGSANKVIPILLGVGGAS
jgi:hypothetical protein